LPASFRRPLTVAVLAATVLLTTGPATGTPSDSSAQAATETCAGRAATLVGSDAADTLVGTSGPDVIVGLGGGDTINARGGADVVCGGAGDDTISGGPGVNRLDGGAGSDIIVGGRDADRLLGGGGVDALAGQQGRDRYNGGAGFDYAAFLAAGGPVHASLVTDTATGEGGDTLAHIEGLIGSEYADRLTGDASANVLVGLGGRDTLRGGGGMDFVLYVLATRGVDVDLRDGWATGEGSDVLVAIESVVGSEHSDNLRGTTGRNYLVGWDGTDTINGRGGGDQCYGENVTGCPTSPPLENQADPAGAATLPRLFPADDDAPAPGERTVPASTSYSAGSVSCPNMSNSAHVSLPTIYGYGYFASRTWHPGSGYSPWSTSTWLFWDTTYGWRYHWSGLWYSFDGYNQWIHGGVSIGVQVWYWSDTYQQWYDLGECITQGVHLIPGMTMVWTGG